MTAIPIAPIAPISPNQLTQILTRIYRVDFETFKEINHFKASPVLPLNGPIDLSTAFPHPPGIYPWHARVVASPAVPGIAQSPIYGYSNELRILQFPTTSSLTTQPQSVIDVQVDWYATVEINRRVENMSQHTGNYSVAAQASGVSLGLSFPIYGAQDNYKTGNIAALGATALTAYDGTLDYGGTSGLQSSQTISITGTSTTTGGGGANSDINWWKNDTEVDIFPCAGILAPTRTWTGGNLSDLNISDTIRAYGYFVMQVRWRF